MLKAPRHTSLLICLVLNVRICKQLRVLEPHPRVQGSSMAEQFKGFDEIKSRFPSAEYVEIEMPLTGQPISLLHHFSPFISKLNDAEFRKHATGTLMFMGPVASSGDSKAKLAFVSRPEGWNVALDPATGKWEEVLLVGSGKSPIQSADFSQLEKLIGG